MDELLSVWRRIREHASRSHAIVDLTEVTFIDQAGEQLLAEMRGAGADLVATSVEHKHLQRLLATANHSSVGLIRRRIERPPGGRQ